MNKAKKPEPRPVASKAKKPEPRPVASKAKKPEPRPVASKSKKPEPRPVASKSKKPEPRPVASKSKKPEPRPVASKSKKPEPRPFSLRAVYLREGKQWMSDNFDPLIPGQSLSGQFMASGHRIDIQEAVENIPDALIIKSCRVTSNFAFRYINIQKDMQLQEGEDSTHLVAEISARITVDYLIETPETPPQNELERWASINALLHCWPYWREFCHSTLLRMNLPIVMMPMMEVNQIKKD